MLCHCSTKIFALPNDKMVMSTPASARKSDRDPSMAHSRSKDGNRYRSDGKPTDNPAPARWREPIKDRARGALLYYRIPNALRGTRIIPLIASLQGISLQAGYRRLTCGSQAALPLGRRRSSKGPAKNSVIGPAVAHHRLGGGSRYRSASEPTDTPNPGRRRQPTLARRLCR